MTCIHFIFSTAFPLLLLTLWSSFFISTIEHDLLLVPCLFTVGAANKRCYAVLRLLHLPLAKRVYCGELRVTMIYDLLTLFNDGVSYAKANAWNIVLLFLSLYILQHFRTIHAVFSVLVVQWQF